MITPSDLIPPMNFIMKTNPIRVARQPVTEKVDPPKLVPICPFILIIMDPPEGIYQKDRDIFGPPLKFMTHQNQFMTHQNQFIN